MRSRAYHRALTALADVARSSSYHRITISSANADWMIEGAPRWKIENLHLQHPG